MSNIISRLSFIMTNMSNKKAAVGLTFGAFEHFHHGHVNLLKNAKKMCEKLIVCVSDDEYIETKKGHMPLLNYEKRVIVVAAVRYVDVVDKQGLGFSKEDAIKKHKPNLLFVGNDWTPKTYTGEGLGVPVVYLQYTKEVSSTIIRLGLDKLKK